MNRRMDKENVVYTCNKMLFRLKKKRNPAIYDMDEPRRHYAKRNMPVTGGQTLYDSTCTRYLKWSNAWKQKIE